MKEKDAELLVVSQMLERFRGEKLAFENVIVIHASERVTSFYGKEDASALRLRLHSLSFLLIEEGTIEIRIDYSPYLLRANDFIIITPAHLLEVIHRENKFEGKVVILTESFINELLTQGNTTVIDQLINIRNSPVFHIEKAGTTRINNAISRIENCINDATHLYHSFMVRNAVMAFLMESGNLVYTPISKGTAATNSSRQEQLYRQFLQLLSLNCKQHHDVSFYAEKVCVSPQYLSRICKSCSAKTAAQWIDDALLTEALMLLQDNDLSIQEISERLYFPDQSAFGKFFKRHKAQSPGSFRRKRDEKIKSA